MGISGRWALQVAIYDRLTTALKGQGIGGVDVPVFDHVPENADRLHVRIDGFGFGPGSMKNSRRGQHGFSVHVFDDNTGETTGAGMADVARLNTLVVSALEDWPPFDGATGITLISSNDAPENDHLTGHAVSRFSTHI